MHNLPLEYYVMRLHEVDALRDRKEFAWTAYVAKTDSGVFRVPRPPVSKKWIMRNVGSSETSEETPVEIVESRGNSDPSEPIKKSAVEEKLAFQPKPDGSKWGRRFIIAKTPLAILYLAWAYILPLLSQVDPSLTVNGLRNEFPTYHPFVVLGKVCPSILTLNLFKATGQPISLPLPRT